MRFSHVHELKQGGVAETLGESDLLGIHEEGLRRLCAVLQGAHEALVVVECG